MVERNKEQQMREIKSNTSLYGTISSISNTLCCSMYEMKKKNEEKESWGDDEEKNV